MIFICHQFIVSFFTFVRLLTTNCESWFMSAFTCRIHFAICTRDSHICFIAIVALHCCHVPPPGVHVCVRKTETEVLSVGSSTYELETKTGRRGGDRGGFGLSTIRSGMQWRPLNCALNPYDGAIDVVTWWRCGTCLDYITMYVCPKRGRREGSERRADSRRCCWL